MLQARAEYREYYDNGKLKLKGEIWTERIMANGFTIMKMAKQIECDFIDGKRRLLWLLSLEPFQTKARLKMTDDVGTWGYEQDGVLAGYYKPLYEDKDLETNQCADGAEQSYCRYRLNQNHCSTALDIFNESFLSIKV